jgi:hypothetical protein
MTRKPNLAKFMLGVAVLALLFIGTWAATRAPLTSAKKSDASTTTSASAIPKMMPGMPGALSPPAGGDAVTSVIELDGDIIDSSPGLIPDDWDTINCDTGNAVARTGVIADGPNKSIFTGGGSKDIIDIPSWQWKDGSTPPKDDLINGYAAKFIGPTGDNILAFGAERASNNGTAFIGVWFYQSAISLNTAGTFDGVHSVGDILVLNTFTQGGSFATAKVYEWVGAGGTCGTGGILQKGGTLCDISSTAPLGSVESISNGSPITIPPGTYASCPWNYPGGIVPTNSFFEGAINLDAFPALTSSCFSSFLIETRSSASVDAVLKDFILGQLNTCPNPDITKTADDSDICAGDTTTYTYVASNPAGAQSVQVSLLDDNATPGTPGDDYDPANSTTSPNCREIVGGVGQAGPGSPFTLAGGATRTFRCTATLAVGAHTNTVTLSFPSGGQTVTKTATATVTVHAIPDARITVMTCADGTTFLTASDANNTGGTFTWTGAGGASTTGTTRTLTGTGSYTVTIDNGFCSDSATRVVSLCSDSVDHP